MTGIDLTPEFIEVARELTRRCGMADHIEFRQADALDLPFAEQVVLPLNPVLCGRAWIVVICFSSRGPAHNTTLNPGYDESAIPNRPLGHRIEIERYLQPGRRADTVISRSEIPWSLLYDLGSIRQHNRESTQHQMVMMLA